MIKQRFLNSMQVFLKTIGAYTTVKAASFLKISYVIGSQVALFSASNVVTPLVGLYGGTLTAFGVTIFGFAIRYVLVGSFSWHILSYFVPGLCASLYFSQPNIATRLLVPALCMALFVVHPTGSLSFAYSLYWLIPIALYFVSKKNKFMHALSSTFIAHAVGSTIWLYTVPMTPAAWYSLIPVVFFERILFATAMVAVQMVVEYGTSVIKKQVPSLQKLLLAK